MFLHLRSLRGEVAHSLFSSLSDFQVSPLFAGRAGSPTGNARASPGGCLPALGPAHSHPPRALQADLRSRPRAGSCVFFLRWKTIRQQGQFGSWIFFFLIYVKNYNLEELIKSYCHSKHGFIHCSVLALDKPGYPVNFPWMTGWCTVHQLSSFWVVIANADSQPPPGPSESECGGERPVNQYWYTVFPVRYVCVSKFENKFVAFHTYCNVKILVPTFFLI